MDSSITIDEHGDLDELEGLFQASMGLESVDAVPGFLALERARGTRYFVARRGDAALGLIGLWFDPSGRDIEVEPPQNIDLGVRPEQRRRGVATALVRRAFEETRQAGHHRLWLFADGNNVGLIAFYRSAGFRLAAATPALPGTCAAR